MRWPPNLGGLQGDTYCKSTIGAVAELTTNNHLPYVSWDKPTTLLQRFWVKVSENISLRSILYGKKSRVAQAHQKLTRISATQAGLGRFQKSHPKASNLRIEPKS
jgi:hypothetical protein